MVNAKISILLPARGRPTHLASSVRSLLDLAADPDDVEVLVRLDDDDPHLDAERAVLRGAAGADVEVGPRLGYSRMHDYYNRLAELGWSRGGRWLFLWNDDVEMLTRGWDALVRDAPEFSVQFPRRDVTKTTDYTFPVIGRPAYEALGATPAGRHFSLNAYCDAWVSDWSAFAGTSVIRDDVAFVHHRLDDATLREQADGGREWARFMTPEQRLLRRADMEAAMAAPGWASRFDDWETSQVDHVGVDYINLAAGERRAGAVRLLGRRQPATRPRCDK